jgi:hypothetical protein
LLEGVDPVRSIRTRYHQHNFAFTWKGQGRNAEAIELEKFATLQVSVMLIIPIRATDFFLVPGM